VTLLVLEISPSSAGSSGVPCARRRGTGCALLRVAFDATALVFDPPGSSEAQRAARRRPRPAAGSAAIGRRFQLELAWLTTGALPAALLPVLGVAVIAAFNAYHRRSIRGESLRPRRSGAGGEETVT
jgi:TMEM175 potassium channel family protein